MTTGRRTRIPGYRLDRAGKIVADLRRHNASARAKRRGSEPVRVATRRSKAALAKLDFAKPLEIGPRT